MKKALFFICVLSSSISGCAYLKPDVIELGCDEGCDNADNYNYKKHSGFIKNHIDLSPTVLNNLITTMLDVKPNADNEKYLVNQGALTSSKISISIAESNEGQIKTNWQPIPGKKAGLYIWEKTYECEVRHIITIERSYQSSSKSDLYISTEVRERPNSNYRWTPANEELGYDSLIQLTSELSETIKKTLNNKAKK